MKRLAHFTLEGLLEQGPHQVWITLGTFPTAEAARRASSDPNTLRAGVLQTRVTPLYRVSVHSPQTLRSASTPAHTTASSHDSVTVA